MKSMSKNQVCDLVNLPQRALAIDCNWIFNTKRDSLDNIKLYKAKLVAKDFSQKEGIDYHKTFSLVSKNDSLRIIMALVAHFDLQLH